jgi:hypothetical protein
MTPFSLTLGSREQLCSICEQEIRSHESFVSCAHNDYVSDELQAMGLDPMIYQDIGRCHSRSHDTCWTTLSSSRACCAAPVLPTNRCLRHLDFEDGFFCYACSRWHTNHSCAVGGLNWIQSVPVGQCPSCDQAERARHAVEDLDATISPEVLIALGDALRDLAVEEETDMMDLLGVVRDFRAVRVPNARRPRVRLRVLIQAAARALAASRALQSGLERAFLELLSEMAIAHEFRPQRPILLDLADRDGKGRRGVPVTPDFTHVALPYVVFLDGRTAHNAETTLADDAEITAELSRRGFLVRRLRYHQLRPRYRRQTADVIVRDIDLLRGRALSATLQP